jgi:2,4-dienoyl-CoA reductase-like NADH-dependent reductase (Old Yellow Enzyme family)
MNSILFEKKIIKNIELKNRFMMSAVGDHRATGEGHITDGQIETFSEIAAGGVALVVLGAVYVHQTGKFIETQVSIADDGCIGGLRKFAKAIHNNGAKAVVQLFHGGRLCAKYQKENGGAALAPSIISDDEHFENKFYTEKYKEATEEEIMEIISSFGDAARRAKDAGFDAIQKRQVGRIP